MSLEAFDKLDRLSLYADKIDTSSITGSLRAPVLNSKECWKQRVTSKLHVVLNEEPKEEVVIEHSFKFVSNKISTSLSYTPTNLLESKVKDFDTLTVEALPSINEDIFKRGFTVFSNKSVKTINVKGMQLSSSSTYIPNRYSSTINVRKLFNIIPIEKVYKTVTVSSGFKCYYNPPKLEDSGFIDFSINIVKNEVTMLSFKPNTLLGMEENSIAHAIEDTLVLYSSVLGVYDIKLRNGRIKVVVLPSSSKSINPVNSVTDETPKKRKRKRTTPKSTTFVSRLLKGRKK